MLGNINVEYVVQRQLPYITISEDLLNLYKLNLHYYFEGIFFFKMMSKLFVITGDQVLLLYIYV
jgi:hypothetical protein